MRGTHRTCARWLRACAAAAALAALAAPGALASVRGCDPSYLRGAYDSRHQQGAIKGAIYAMLASNAYPAESQPRFKLPPEWTKLPYAFEDKVSGLQMDVYEHRAGGDLVEVVVAFRGTTGTQDWLHGNILSSQYEALDAMFPGIAAKYPGTPLVAVGHSLGGGLALHASLVFPNVTAFAFDPSYKVRSAGRPYANERYVYWASGDILELQRKLWGRPPGTAEYGNYYFISKDAHRSYWLARGLLLLAALTDAESRALLELQCAR